MSTRLPAAESRGRVDHVHACLIISRCLVYLSKGYRDHSLWLCGSKRRCRQVCSMNVVVSNQQEVYSLSHKYHEFSPRIVPHGPPGLVSKLNLTVPIWRDSQGIITLRPVCRIHVSSPVDSSHVSC